MTATASTHCSEDGIVVERAMELTGNVLHGRLYRQSTVVGKFCCDWHSVLVLAKLTRFHATVSLSTCVLGYTPALPIPFIINCLASTSVLYFFRYRYTSLSNSVSSLDPIEPTCSIHWQTEFQSFVTVPFLAMHFIRASFQLYVLSCLSVVFWLVSSCMTIEHVYTTTRRLTHVKVRKMKSKIIIREICKNRRHCTSSLCPEIWAFRAFKIICRAVDR